MYGETWIFADQGRSFRSETQGYQVPRILLGSAAPEASYDPKVGHKPLLRRLKLASSRPWEHQLIRESSKRIYYDGDKIAGLAILG